MGIDWNRKKEGSAGIITSTDNKAKRGAQKISRSLQKFSPDDQLGAVRGKIINTILMSAVWT